MTNKQFFTKFDKIYRHIRDGLTNQTTRKSQPDDLKRYRLRLLAIARQNRRLRSQLSDLGIKRITEGRKATEAENCFDAKTYREALDLTVKQEVYEKILKVVGGITLLGSFGLIVLLQNTVNDRVKKEFEENPAITQLTEERDRSRRDTLLALMQAAIQSDDNSWAEERIKINVKEIPEYDDLMEELLQENTVIQERELAIDYAGETQDPVLRDELLEELKKPLDAEIRLKIFQALMQYPPDVQISALDVLKQEGENSQGEFWQGAIEILAATKISSPIAGEVMSKALQKAESFQVAATFFILNPDTWKDEYDSLVAQESQHSPLNSLINLSAIDQLSPLQQKQTEEILQALIGLTQEEESSDHSTQIQDFVSEEQLENIHQYFALKLLSAGNNRLFRDNNDYNYRHDYDSVWKMAILPLFPSFNSENSKDILDATTEEEQQMLQEELIDELNAGIYVWNAQNSRYEKLNQYNGNLAIDSIKSGYLDVFLFEDAPNFTEDYWKEHVFPIFSAAISQAPDPLFSTQPTGTEEEQEKLWEWIKDEDELHWDATSQTYQYLTEEESIVRLNQGDLRYFLTWMTYYYYDRETTAWQQKILRFFPNVRQATPAFFTTNNPTGTDEEQDRLWRWVQAHQLQLEWHPERKEYQLTN